MKLVAADVSRRTLNPRTDGADLRPRYKTIGEKVRPMLEVEAIQGSDDREVPAPA